MIDTNLITTIGAVTVLIIGAIATAAVKVIEAIHQSEIRKNVKTDEIIKTTNQIHDLTNARLENVTSKLETALTEIEGLKKLISAFEIKDAITEAKRKR